MLHRSATEEWLESAFRFLNRPLRIALSSRVIWNEKNQRDTASTLSCVVQILCIVRGDGVRKTIIIQTNVHVRMMVKVKRTLWFNTCCLWKWWSTLLLSYYLSSIPIREPKHAGFKTGAHYLYGQALNFSDNS